MTTPQSAIAAPTASRCPQATLSGLMACVGDTGLAASALLPGLLAAVDQHSAAVRDSLGGDRPLTADALAGYADGIRDAARQHGWRPAQTLIKWSSADWVLTRLLAVCALAAQLPVAD